MKQLFNFFSVTNIRQKSCRIFVPGKIYNSLEGLTWILSEVSSTVSNMRYPSPFWVKVNGSQVAIVCVVIITRKEIHYLMQLE